MKTRTFLRGVGFALALVTSANSQTVTMSPLLTFGGGDGWLSPGEGGTLFLTTNATDRGIAYNPITDNLYLTSRVNVGGDAIHIRVLNGATGVDTGIELNDTGITGGTFPINLVATGTDGAIYVSNLASPVGGATATPFKIYRWANELAAPTEIFSSTTVSTGRLGDTLDVIGGGSSTVIVAGESASAGTGTRNSFVALGTADGITFTGGRIAFTGTPPNNGDFRLGEALLDNNTVLGVQGGTGNPARLADFDLTTLTGSLVGSATMASLTDRGFDYAIVGGIPLLATVETNTNVVRVYNMTDPLNPFVLVSGNTAGAFVAGNTAGAGTSQAEWGEIAGDTAILYASNTNNGIQAFTITVPEPSCLAFLGIATVGFAFRRRR
jgi:hypothetical protein